MKIKKGQFLSSIERNEKQARKLIHAKNDEIGIKENMIRTWVQSVRTKKCQILNASSNNK